MASESPAAAQPAAPTVSSRWWYVLAAVPVVLIVSMIVGIALFATVLSGTVADDPAPSENPFEGLDIGAGTLAAVGLVGALSAVVVLLAPVAFYLDAQAVSAAGVDWDPDPVLWVVIGVVGIFFTLLQVGGAIYYLYQRHEHVGTP